MRAEQFSVHEELEDSHWWFVGRRRVMGHLVDDLLGGRGLVIDVGCGTGANIASLSPRYRAVGIDPSPEAIEAARLRFPSVEFRLGMAPQDLGGLAAEADLILLMDVIEHVDEDRALVANLVEAARPGAHLLITVPAGPQLWTRHDEAFGHRRRYTPPVLREVWRGLSVEEIMVSYFNRRLYPAIRGVRALNARRGKVSGIGGTDFKLPPAPVNAALAATLGGEAGSLRRRLQRRQVEVGWPGVSLIAVLQVESGGRP